MATVFLFQIKTKIDSKKVIAEEILPVCPVTLTLFVTHRLCYHHQRRSRFDAARIRHMLERHKHYTNSVRAREILDNWDEYLPKFIKVMPVDYRRALAEMQASRAVERAVAAGE